MEAEFCTGPNLSVNQFLKVGHFVIDEIEMWMNVQLAELFQKISMSVLGHKTSNAYSFYRLGYRILDMTGKG